MKLILGIIIGVTSTITLTYMVVSIGYAVCCLLDNAAKEEKKTIKQIVEDRIYSFAAFVVVSFMVFNLLIIVCDRLAPL